jgi:5-methylcytosine-specific restriction endonuclease McrA
LCGSTADNAPLEVDHIIAIVHGGKNTTDNLRTLCELCNMGKAFEEGER